MQQQAGYGPAGPGYMMEGGYPGGFQQGGPQQGMPMQGGPQQGPGGMQGGQPHQQARAQAQAAVAAQPNAKPQVPPGWTAQFDNNTQMWYYINNATLATQWEVPTEPVYVNPGAANGAAGGQP